MSTTADLARAPLRAVRPRTLADLAFLSLGAAAEAFLRAAGPAGASRLGHETFSSGLLHPRPRRPPTCACRAASCAGLLKAYRSNGLAGLVHVNSGRRPVNRPAVEKRRS